MEKFQYPHFISLLFSSDFSTCTTVTYSIWLKYQRKQVGKTTFIIRSYAFGSKTGILMENRNGGYLAKFQLGDEKRWALEFGKQINQIVWNQFTFTIDNSVQACAYINGVKEICETKPSSNAYTIDSNVKVKLGGGWLNGNEPAIYFDNFAIWRSILTDDEVMMLYNDSKI